MTEFAYQIGSYSLIPGQGLFRDKQPVPLPPKELGLLELLASEEGRVVSQREIERVLWPRQEVSYSSIARCVYSLRRTLGDDGPRYIVTVPRRGYRMAIPVNRRSLNNTSHAEQVSRYQSAPAFSHYLEGLREANRMHSDALSRAIALFDRAHQQDPGFLVPLAAIADCRMYEATRGYAAPAEANRLAVEACQRALNSDPEIVSALAALGWFRGVIGRRCQDGLDLVDESLRLDSNYARAHSYRAWILRGSGSPEDAVAAARAAVDLDPHSVLTVHCLVWTLFLAGQADEALEIERRLRSEMPYHDVAHGYTALIAAWLGNIDEAVTAGREAVRVSRDNPSMQSALAYALAEQGAEREARKLAAAAAGAALPRVTRSHLAPVYLALGDSEKAIYCLEAARQERCPFFPGARYDPRLASLLSDPDVAALWQ